MNEVCDISELVGKTVRYITGVAGDQEITFRMTDDSQYQMRHNQNSCESVRVDEIIGDLQDLIDSPILQAEVVIQKDAVTPDLITWTFYKLATTKGFVTIFWHGTSSEAVDFERVT